ncbi:pyruvate dehydrogenase [archaeon]|nr:pyruvate dehydrogenase [archaeon]
MTKFRCTVCNWVYDESKQKKKFSSLPDSYICPVCGAPKSAFVPLSKITQKTSTNVADKIVKQLEAFNVKHIYGIPGESNLPIIDAIRRSKIKFILTRHEETAAFMASAHGKITDSLGVCISIAGPGSTNLITGLVDAATDRSPVLALAGQIPEIYLGSEAFQEIDQIELFQSFTEFAETISKPNQALKLTKTAIKNAYKKPGVSVLSTPTDILTENLPEKIFKPEIFQNPTFSNKNIKKAAQLINNSNKITILAGWGARHSSKLLLQLSQKLKAPIATTSRAKGVINETYKYSLGVLGSIGSIYAAKSIADSDLIIIIGSGFRQANLVPPNMKIIQIDNDSLKIGKTFNVDAGLLGDSDLILQKLVPLISNKQENKKFIENINKYKQEHLNEIEKESKDFSTPINPGFVIQALKNNINKNAIICVDVGDHTFWFYKKFICEGQKTFMSANMASMAFSLPASLSAQLDFPNKQVICITGDGGFGMLMADFTTAVREKLPIKVILFNDEKLKNIKKEQIRDGYPEFGVSFPNPNFAEFAKSCGGDGYRVINPKNLNNILKKAFQSKKPTIVEIMIDPNKMIRGVKKV